MPDMNRSVTVSEVFKLFVEGWTTCVRLSRKLSAKKIFPRSKKLRENSSKLFESLTYLQMSLEISLLSNISEKF